MSSFMPLAQAVLENLEDGDMAAFEGHIHLIPTAVVHEETSAETRQSTVVPLHAGVTRETAQQHCGWPAGFADNVETMPAPMELDLKMLRDLQARTKAAREGAGLNENTGQQ